MADISKITQLSNVIRPFQRKVEAGVEDVKEAGGFKDLLMNSINKVNDAQLNAEKAVEDYATGKNKNLHEAMLAIESANISMRLMVKTRNKIIEAYQEVMRMPI